MSEKGQFVVSGQVFRDGKPAVGVRVTTYHKTVRGQRPLSRPTIADEKGQYEFQIEIESLQALGTFTPSLVVEAVDPFGNYAGKSKLIPKAVSPTKVEPISLSAQVARPESEYERVTRAIAPALDGIEVDELTDDEIGYIVEVQPETKREQIDALRLATGNSRETKLPVGLHYALIRTGRPSAKKDLLKLSPEEFSKILEQALSRDLSLAPASLARKIGVYVGVLKGWKADEKLAREASLERHTLRGRVLTHEDKPVRGRRIRAVEISPTERDLGETTTDGLGRFDFTYTAEPGSQEKKLEIEVRFSVYAAASLRRKSDPVYVGEQKVVVGQTEPVSIELPQDATQPIKRSELYDAIDLPSLRPAGFETVTGISRMPRLRYGDVAKNGTRLKDFPIHRTWFAARTISRLLESMVVGARADLARAPKLKSKGSDLTKQVSALAASSNEYNCHCTDCETAVSPGAYLADLLDFSLTHLQKGAALIDLADLESILLQPIGQLPAWCDETEDRVSQIRLCIEVIRRALTSAGIAASPALGNGEAAYRVAAYTALLEKIGTSYTELHLAASALPEVKQALADRLGIAIDRLPELTLDPGSLTEAELEEIFGLRQTNPANPLAPLQQIPKVLAWRRELLVQTWTAQDHPLSWTLVDPLVMDPASAPAWLKSPPVIDPDLIGPDDFRIPVPKTNQGDPDKPFDLWLARRKFVDAELKALDARRTGGGAFQDLLDRLNAQVTYRNSVHQPPWQNQMKISDLVSLRAGLRTATDLKAKRKELAETLYLEPESLERLIELGIKDQESRINTSNVSLPLSAEEWDEVYSILVQVQKRSLAAVWKNEEGNANFSDGHYWISQREPEVGNWAPKDLVAGKPLIDPELVRLSDLPETIVGDKAIKRWKERHAKLQAEREAIKQKRELAGFDEMLKYALGDPNAGDPVPHGGVDQLYQELNLNDVQRVQTAKQQIQNLNLSEEAFRQIVAIKVKDASPNQRPTVAEYEEIYNLLLPAHKQKHLFTPWLQEEGSDSLTAAEYWVVRKARLARWRASVEQRARWQAVLRSYLGPVVIDPDLVFPGEIVNPASGTPAYDLWNARQQAVAARLNALSQQPQNAAGFDQRLRDNLGIDQIGLMALDAERSQGTNIGPRLAQLNLPFDAFNELQRVSKLLGANAPTLQSDWDAVANILAAAWKRSQFPMWHQAEQLGKITLSSDHFHPPVVDPLVFPPPPPPELPAWRATATARRDWLSTLESRIEQETTLAEGLRKAVSDTEGTTLPQLRDALLRKFPHPSASATLHERAKAFKGKHQIETQNAGCALTTRLAQAIESVQGLLFAVRSGQYAPAARLSIDSEVFDEAWPIVGSYETWRANMLVYLYPENLLLPTLRPWRTQAFDALATALREAPRLDAEVACHIARDYEAYFKDITSLDIQATCEAMTRINEGRCRTPTCQSRALFYMFARGGETGAVYWSVYDPSDGTDYAQTPWTAVPGVSSILQIVGAVPYHIAEKHRYIYLFLSTRERATQKLSYVRYDLENQQWESQPVELELSIDDEDAVVDFTAVVLQRPGRGEGREPHVALRLPNGAVYDRGLDRDGKDWRGDKWRLLVPRRVGEQFESLRAMIGMSRGRFCLIATTSTSIAYYVYGDGRDDGQWRPLADGAYRGAFLSPETKDIFVFFVSQASRGGDLMRWRRIAWRDAALSQFGVVLSSLESFDEWLKKIAGVSFREEPASDDEPGQATAFETLLQFRDDDSRFSGVAHSIVIGLRQRSADWELANDRVRTFTMGSKQLGAALVKAVIAIPHNLLFVKQRDDDDELGDQMPPFFPLPGNRKPGPGILSIVRHMDATNLGTDQARSRTTVRLCINNPFRPQATLVTTNGDAVTREPGVPAAPHVDNPRSITADLTAAQRQGRHAQMEEAYLDNAGSTRVNLEYLDEAYFFVPMQIALQLQARGQYLAALDWYRTVYDYEASLVQRTIFVGLEQEGAQDDGNPNHWVLERGDRWLLDLTNPHGVATTRSNAYTRFTLMSIIRCLLDFADAEFTRDTSETVARARRLYGTALELLDLDELRSGTTECEDVLATLDIEIREKHITRVSPWLGRWADIHARGRAIASPTQARQFADNARRVLQTRNGLSEKLRVIDRELRRILETQSRALPKLKEIVARRQQEQEKLESLIDKSEMVTRIVDKFSSVAVSAFETPIMHFTGKSREELREADLAWLNIRSLNRGVDLEIPNLGFLDIDSWGCAGKLLPRIDVTYTPALPPFSFCVPSNPVVKFLRLRANLNLYKALSCRNIAGELRDLEPYAAPTDVASGLPMIGAGEQIVLPGAARLAPTPYRYAVLIDRAKQLVAHAQQLENAFLSALQQRDAESYNLLRARQDVSLSRAGLRLQELRVTEAEDGVALAELQQERSEINFEYYDDLLAHGLLKTEEAALNFQYGLLVAQTSLAYLYAQAFIASQGVAVDLLFRSLDLGLASTQTFIGIFTALANHERREQEWRWQRSLAEQDLRIGWQQITLAKDQERIVGQERAIAELQTEHASAVVDFLSTKFTNAELFAWMSNILEGAYHYFLQQATAMAQLAAMQLAFERQETPPPFIQADYWEAPNDSVLSPTDGRGPDRRGLTGSARLLQDIFQLDQYAFQTDRLKEKRSKTISLVQLFPGEFQRFRETGVLRFETPMSLFDQELPGEYLRLVKRVRVTVIALVPPTTGIRATLTADHHSRVVIGGDLFQPIRIERGSNRMTITSPIPGPEPEPESPMLQPFEGMGVDTRWEFRMPKAANPIDYSSIADILVTIDYTALFSADFYQQVIQTLDSEFMADRAYSFRQQFADAWYDLNNPELSSAPMRVAFNTKPEDFPGNLSEIRIRHVSLYFACDDAGHFEVPVSALLFTEQGSNAAVGGGAMSSDRVISTRSGSATSWAAAMIGKSSVGEWELALPNTQEMKNRFKNEEIEDILFVITYSGRTPEWPA
jgi:hypothetical protein